MSLARPAARLASLARMGRRAMLAAAAGVLATCTPPDDLSSHAAGPLTIGEPAPAYEAVTLDGDSASLADRRGKVVLLNIWATWCTPCRTELPVLQALHERYAGEGLELIGVSVDAAGEQRKVRDFLREFGITYDIWHDPGERVATTFFAIGVPATYLIDRDGTLLWKHIGPVRANDPRLMPLLRRALGEAD